MAVVKDSFGSLSDGREVDIFTLTNKNGIKVSVMTFGATMVELSVPDRDGNMADINLGFDTVGEYPEKSPYFGCIAGRYANRIDAGKFTQDGVEYTLAINNEPNHLHGGDVGFDKVIWDAEEVAVDGGSAVKFSYLSKDGEEGYPGNLSISVVYKLTDNNELSFEYDGEIDKACPVNLTNHSYYNLAGEGSGDIFSHEMMICADAFTPVRESDPIPTGEIKAVAGTPWDFTKSHPIGDRYSEADDGYDHNFVLRGQDGQLEMAARVYEPTSGRVMEVWTTEPGIQFYSGIFLDGFTGKAGKVYNQYGAFCLETQHYPDSPNQPGFPSCVLEPGQRYKHLTVHKFSVR